MGENSKEQCVKTLRERYFARSKKEKTKILNKYYKKTKEDRKHTIKKFNYEKRFLTPFSSNIWLHRKENRKYLKIKIILF